MASHFLRNKMISNERHFEKVAEIFKIIQDLTSLV